MNNISKFWENFLNYEKSAMNDHHIDNSWVISYIRQKLRLKIFFARTFLYGDCLFDKNMKKRNPL